MLAAYKDMAILGEPRVGNSIVCFTSFTSLTSHLKFTSLTSDIPLKLGSINPLLQGSAWFQSFLGHLDSFFDSW